MQSQIYRLETVEKYVYPFERLKHILGKDYHSPAEKEALAKKEKEEAEKKKKLDIIKEEDEEPMIKEIDEEEEKQIEEEKEKNNVIKSSKVESDADIKKKLNEEVHKIDLAEIEEGASIVKEEDIGTRKLLKGFKQANIKIHLLSGDIKNLYIKKAFNNFFDAGVLSMHSANKVEEPLSSIFKNGAKVHVETADFLCILKKDQKSKYR